MLYVVLAELILAIFSHSETALFTLFGAATLLPAVMYASTVVLYLIKRKSLPVSDKFNLGAWEIPILVVAVVWLVFELALFRDSSFKQAWAYVIVMVVIGACYLGYLLATRGKSGLTMPGMHSIDAEIDAEAAKGLERCTTSWRSTRALRARRRSSSTTAGQVVVDRRGLGAARSIWQAAASSRIPRRCSTRWSTRAGKPWRRRAFRSPRWRWPTRARPSWRGTATPAVR